MPGAHSHRPSSRSDRYGRSAIDARDVQRGELGGDRRPTPTQGRSRSCALAPSWPRAWHVGNFVEIRHRRWREDPRSAHDYVATTIGSGPSRTSGHHGVRQLRRVSQTSDHRRRTGLSASGRIRCWWSRSRWVTAPSRGRIGDPEAFLRARSRCRAASSRRSRDSANAGRQARRQGQANHLAQGQGIGGNQRPGDHHQEADDAVHRHDPPGLAHEIADC